MLETLFFDGWSGILRTLVAGPFVYVALIAAMRVSGKRTLSQLNAFDFVVTVAFGSTVATILLNSSVTVAEGVVALATLIGLQYAVAWSSVRSERLARLVRSEPTVLFSDGRFCREAMRSERVTENELRQVMRKEGHDDPTGVRAVILESDGAFSVLTR